MEAFEFKIGELVRMKTNREGSPARLMVIGRVTEEHPGGVQRHYRLRQFTSDDSILTSASLVVHDIEVCRTDD